MGVLATVDPDGGDTHTYSFCGGADDGKFSITGSNLIANPAFDFETPVDANTDNVYSICIRTTDNGTGNLTYDETITVTITDVDDTVPSTPTLATTSVAVTTIGLSWSTSTDNVAVDFYRLFRDGTLIATTSSSTTLVFTDTGLTGSTSYSYALAAVDTSGNVSGTSTLSQKPRCQLITPQPISLSMALTTTTSLRTRREVPPWVSSLPLTQMGEIPIPIVSVVALTTASSQSPEAT